MHIFYVSNINDLFLDKEESHHCTKVLRLKENDRIFIVNGKGMFVAAEITEISEKKTRYQILEVQDSYHKLPYNLTIFIAPTKNINRFEWFLEKATEIGVGEIFPILCEHSERKVIKNDRLNKVIIAAAKQSQKAYFPILHEMKSFSEIMEEFRNTDSGKYIAYCDGGEKLEINEISSVKNIIIGIGPEGDFSQKEIQSAEKSGFHPLSLGSSRLRTETAAVHACSAIKILHDIKKQ